MSPVNYTLAQQSRMLVGDVTKGGVIPAIVESVVNGMLSVRVTTNGRRISNIPVIGSASRLQTGDEVHLLETQPNEYLALSPKQQYSAGSPPASDHTHSQYLSLEQLTQMLSGYALVSHTHPSQSLSGYLRTPSPAVITYVDSAGYEGTSSCPGAYYDHRHYLPIDTGVFGWTSGSLTTSASGLKAGQPYPGSEGAPFQLGTTNNIDFTSTSPRTIGSITFYGVDYGGGLMMAVFGGQQTGSGSIAQAAHAEMIGWFEKPIGGDPTFTAFHSNAVNCSMQIAGEDSQTLGIRLGGLVDTDPIVGTVTVMVMGGARLVMTLALPGYHD